MSVQSLNAADK